MTNSTPVGRVTVALENAGYLCSELSPAFEGDRLITVELGRTANGDSVTNTLVRDWKQDLAIAAWSSLLALVISQSAITACLTTLSLQLMESCRLRSRMNGLSQSCEGQLFAAGNPSPPSSE